MEHRIPKGKNKSNGEFTNKDREYAGETEREHKNSEKT